MIPAWLSVFIIILIVGIGLIVWYLLSFWLLPRTSHPYCLWCGCELTKTQRLYSRDTCGDAMCLEGYGDI